MTWFYHSIRDHLLFFLRLPPPPLPLLLQLRPRPPLRLRNLCYHLLPVFQL